MQFFTRFYFINIPYLSQRHTTGFKLIISFYIPWTCVSFTNFKNLDIEKRLHKNFENTGDWFFGGKLSMHFGEDRAKTVFSVSNCKLKRVRKFDWIVSDYVLVIWMNTNFGDPVCSCGLEPEAAVHYLLRCNLYFDLRAEPLNDIGI